MIKKADLCDTKTVRAITEQTISSVYPQYYPKGAVEFFLSHHNENNIINDIEKGIVYILYENENAVGTVTIRDNEICRLFVLPEHQGKGCGGRLLDFAEKNISENHSKIIIDASLPAKPIYLKRGYIFTEYHTIETDNGDFLCYDVMEKVL
ncbi:MAG: GNAT family N-acetyltransferase [Ruminococcus sp.]|nr:GNAT family N-acetyltransferase [Ruminococcus sp.]